MKLLFESAMVCTGTLLAALLVVFGEPVKAELLIAEAATVADFTTEVSAGAACAQPGRF